MAIPLDAQGKPNVRLGTRVIETDGRHEGHIRTRQWDNTLVVVWDDTKWVSTCHHDELDIIA